MTSHDRTSAEITTGGTGDPVDVTRSRSTGIARFAGMTMAILGILQIVAATMALLEGAVPAARQGAFSSNATTWGWIHLGLGAVVGLAGMAAIVGELWGRIVGIALAALTIAACFLSLSHHPALSILGIALGVVVIWALCVFDEAASAASPTMLD
jgi:FtsH-binding integral membrane protein